MNRLKVDHLQAVQGLFMSGEFIMLIWKQHKEKFERGGIVILERDSVAWGYMIRKHPFKSYHIFHKGTKIARARTLRAAKQTAQDHHRRFLINA